MGGRRGREVNNGAENIGSASRGSRGDEQLTILIAVPRAPMCATLGVMERSSHCQKQCATGAQTTSDQEHLINFPKGDSARCHLCPLWPLGL